MELLLNKGYRVKALDNLEIGTFKNLKHLKKSKNFTFKKLDIRSLKKVKFFKKVDYVFHFAGIADLVPSIENPQKYIETNMMGTINMLEASRHNNIKKFIYAASASCYGKTEKKSKKVTQ